MYPCLLYVCILSVRMVKYACVFANQLLHPQFNQMMRASDEQLDLS
jgi:hypothetical protein